MIKFLNFQRGILPIALKIKFQTQSKSIFWKKKFNKKKANLTFNLECPNAASGSETASPSGKFWSPIPMARLKADSNVAVFVLPADPKPTPTARPWKKISFNCFRKKKPFFFNSDQFSQNIRKTKKWICKKIRQWIKKWEQTSGILWTVTARMRRRMRRQDWR